MHPLSHYEAIKQAYDEQRAWDERHQRRLRSAPLPRSGRWAQLWGWLRGKTAERPARVSRIEACGDR